MQASDIDVRAADDDPTLLVRVGEDVYEMDRRANQPNGVWVDIERYVDVVESFEAKPQCQDVPIAVAKMIGELAWGQGFDAAY